MLNSPAWPICRIGRQDEGGKGKKVGGGKGEGSEGKATPSSISRGKQASLALDFMVK